MDRKEELLNVIEDFDLNIKTIVEPLLNDIVFLEKELDRLRQLPQIRVHPTNPQKQEVTPASKLYKDFISRYTDIFIVSRIAVVLIGVDEWIE